EAERGIVDKFIGDSVMAFWTGAPSDYDDAAGASAALRAALAIRMAVRAENAGREAPVRLRVGIHSGRVILGNIGTPTRLNFTIVGGAVNIAQRIEARGKQLTPGADVTILLSAATARLLPPEIRVQSLGEQHLEGVETPVELFALADAG